MVTLTMSLGLVEFDSPLPSSCVQLQLDLMRMAGSYVLESLTEDVIDMVTRHAVAAALARCAPRHFPALSLAAC
jgi:hypothetical protein